MLYLSTNRNNFQIGIGYSNFFQEIGIGYSNFYKSSISELSLVFNQ